MVTVKGDFLTTDRMFITCDRDDQRRVKKLLDLCSEDVVLCVTDVNECNDGSARCYLHSQCVNNEGSYRCVCDAGYSPWGRMCMGELKANNEKCNNGHCIPLT